MIVEAPPAPPAPPLATQHVDEDPMRRELLRQIARLEATMVARWRRGSPLSVPPATGALPDVDGPRVLSTEHLERVRDGLLSLRGGRG